MLTGFVCIFIITPTVKAADPGWWTDTDYDHCKRILFSAGEHIASGLTDFVMRLSIVDDDDLYANMSDNSDGDELLFTPGYGAGANQSQLSHEIEYWDTTGNDVSAEIWVNATSVDSEIDTKVWMYYGKTVGSSNENVVDTWDNGYVGVWHLGDIAGGTVYDSLGVHDSTYITSLADDSTGQIGHGGTFSEGFARLTYSSALAFSVGDDFTITAWVKSTDDSNNQRIFTCGDESGNSYYMTELRDAGGGADEDHLILMKASAGASAHSSGSGDGTMIVDGAWHHVTGVYKQAAGTDLFSYLNGTLDASHDGDLGGSLTGHDVAYIGRAYNSNNSNYKFNGDMDEVRVSNVARSADWVKLEFHTSNLTNGFLTIGPDIEYEGDWVNRVPTFGTPTPLDGATGVSLTPSTSAIVYDQDGNATTVNWYWGADEGEVTTHYGMTASHPANTSASKTASFATDYNTQYYWKMTANDGHANETSAIWDFTTMDREPIISGEIPANTSTGISITPTLNITATDPDGNSMDVTWYENQTTSIGDPIWTIDTNPFYNPGGQYEYGPTVVKESASSFHLFYNPTNAATRDIDHATAASIDGEFTEDTGDNPVVDLGAAGEWYEQGGHANDVLSYANNGTAIKVSGNYYMFLYGDRDGTDGDGCIGYATTTDLSSTWTLGNVVLNESGYDDENIGKRGMAVWYEDSMYHMIYCGENATPSQEFGICYANSSSLTGGWTKYASNPILEPTVGWEGYSVTYPDIWKEGDTYIVTYTGGNSATDDECLGVASGTDLFNLVKDTDNPIAIPVDPWEDEGISDFSFHRTATNDYLIYEGESGSAYACGRMWCDDILFNGTSWVSVQINASVGNGSYSYDFVNGTEYSTTYYWMVNLSDGLGGYDQEIFHFTTGTGNAPVLSSPSLFPASGVASYTTFYFNVTWTDIDGDDPTDGYLNVTINKTGWSTNVSMIWVSGSNTTGAIYTNSTTLTAGSYYYHFWAYDGIGKDDSGLHGPFTVSAQDYSFTIVYASGPANDMLNWTEWTLTLTGVGLTTEYNVSEDNQTAVVSAVNITNTGNVALNFTMSWDANPGTGITMKYNTTNNAPLPSDSSAQILVAPSTTTIIVNLAPEAYEEIWLWMDFVNVGAGGDNEDAKVESSIYES